MACKNVCRLCSNLTISADVTFTAPNLIINIPAGSYANCEKYCIVVAQAIPEATTITAPVFVTIGTGTELYPLNRCDGTQVTAAELRTRTRYAVKVATTPTTGSFNLLGKLCGARNIGLAAIDGTAPVAGA
ncbi:MAG: hypothetical protein U0L12_11875 [Ruminococcus sp.]|mgnify:CR=1 FL=1|nr:hypothetical protein [Ruminococcus sp.]